MKKVLALFILSLLLVKPVMAVERNASRAAELREIRTDLKDKVATMRAQLQEKIKLWKGRIGHITEATVVSKSGTVITINKEDNVYTVNTDTATKYRRHYWGNSSFDEISVGDKVNVWGKWADDGRITINAMMIRNLSVMRRHGVFVGEVKSLSSTGFVLKSVNRGDQMVTIASTTKYLDRKEGMISFADIELGDKVRVRGLWDKTLSTITEVTQVKDYALPVKPTPTATPAL